ncbi:MAG: hypothetical protein AB7D57_10515 [Desulfovibrionaceae bacterium]
MRPLRPALSCAARPLGALCVLLVLTLALLPVPAPAAAAEDAAPAQPDLNQPDPYLPSLSLDGADAQYQATIQRMAQITTQVLPIIDRAAAINAKAPLPGVPLKDQLNAQDLAEFQKLTRVLHALYSRNAFESSFARDLELLDGLYRAAVNLHAAQMAYVERTGTARGFNDWMQHDMKLDPDDYFYLELLLRLQGIRPSSMEKDFARLPKPPDAVRTPDATQP